MREDTIDRGFLWKKKVRAECSFPTGAARMKCKIEGGGG